MNRTWHFRSCPTFVLMLAIAGLVISSTSTWGDLVLFRIVVGGKCGYMNRRGEVVIQPKFTHCGDFHQGMAWATDESTIAFDQRKTKYGYINEQGTFAIEKQYVLAGDFSEDRALVAPDGDSIGYIDRTGQLVIQPKYNEAEDFNNGVALVG